MRIGDKVRVLRISPNLVDDDVMHTRAVFERCVGHVFRIAGFQGDWIELKVGNVTRNKFETIWIEVDCVELVRSRGKR
jgi:hypothetical protein